MVDVVDEICVARDSGSWFGVLLSVAEAQKSLAVSGEISRGTDRVLRGIKLTEGFFIFVRDPWFARAA